MDAGSGGGGGLGGVFPICLDLSEPSWVICGWGANEGSWVGVGRCGGVFVPHLVFIAPLLKVLRPLNGSVCFSCVTCRC